MHNISCRIVARSLLISRSHNTELATATQNSQSSLLKVDCPNARCRNGTYTTRICRSTDTSNRRPEPSIREEMGERASLVRPGIDHVEDLKQHQRRERHCLRIRQIAGTLDHAAGQRRVEHEQSARRHDRADEDDAAPHLRGEHAFTRWARWLVHQPFIGGIDAQAPAPEDRRSPD